MLPVLQYPVRGLWRTRGQVGARGAPGAPSVPRCLPLPQEDPGLPLPPCGRCSIAGVGSVSSVSPVLVHWSHCGVVLWCLQRRERETGAAAADPPSERATRTPFHAEGKGPFPLCGRCPCLGTELFQEHKDQRPPQGPAPPGFTGVPPATVVLQDKWALAHGADVRVTFLASWLVHRESSLL